MQKLVPVVIAAILIDRLKKSVDTRGSSHHTLGLYNSFFDKVTLQIGGKLSDSEEHK